MADTDAETGGLLPSSCTVFECTNDADRVVVDTDGDLRAVCDEHPHIREGAVEEQPGEGHDG